MVRHGTSAIGVLDSILGLLAGLVVTFAGYRLARGLSGLAGFLVGFVLGLLLGIVSGPIGALIIGVVLGIVFAIIFVLAFRLVGAALGAFAGAEIAIAFAWPVWAVIAMGALGLVVGLFANRLVLVLATSWVGATLAVTSAVELLYDMGMKKIDNEGVALFWAAIALAIVGSIVQWRAVRHDR